MDIYVVLYFILGTLFGYIFTNIGFRVPMNKNLFEKSKCDYCSRELTFIEKIPILSFIIQKGKCNYCHQKINKLYFVFEIITGLLFSFIYMKYSNSYNSYLSILMAFVFISSLLIVTISDIKYMLIPDKLLVMFSVFVVILKVLIGIQNEELTSFLDVGYMIIFMIIDAFIIFCIMFLIKKMGDLLFKKESLGGGDIKLMTYVSLIMGYKMSIIIIFVGSFIALPFSIVNAYKKNEVMLPFGPYLGIASIILFLLDMNFDSFLNLIR